jgi:hypothetical protein
MWNKNAKEEDQVGGCSTSITLTGSCLPHSSIDQFLGLLPWKHVTTKMTVCAGLLVYGVTQIKLPETNHKYYTRWHVEMYSNWYKLMAPGFEFVYNTPQNQQLEDFKTYTAKETVLTITTLKFMKCA